jgi:hypothetical protein
MNKLINLLIIFLALRYLFPTILASVNMPFLDSALKLRLFIAIGILLIQMGFNYGMHKMNKKQTTLKQNFYNSLFTGLIIFAGFVIYEDVKSNYNVTFTGLNETTVKSAFVTFLLTFFILTKCLITP